MANRLSTAQILAAARATDGKGVSGAKVVAPAALAESAVEMRNSSSSVALLENEDSSEDFGVRSDKVERSEEIAPLSMAKVIAATRGDANGLSGSEIRPPSIASMLAQVRTESPAVATVPPSVVQILASIRGDSPVRESVASTSAESATSGNKKSPTRESSTPAVRGGTSSILAAARRQGAAGGAKAPAKTTKSSPAERPSGTAAILAAARQQKGPSSDSPQKAQAGTQAGTSSSKPTPAKGAGRGSSSSILEAARRQGAAGGVKQPAKNAGDAAGRPSGTAAILAAARQQKGAAPVSPSTRKSQEIGEKTIPPSRSTGDADPADGRSRPARMAEILAEIRCEAGAGLVPSELPSLIEMVASLRQQSEQRLIQRSRRPAPAKDWTSRVRDWLAGWKNRIAVRQFDHS